MPDSEQYKFESTGLESPAYTGEAVTPSDVTDLSEPCRALYIGSAGNLSVEMIDGTSLTFVNIQAGSLFPIRVNRVNATSTTASNIVALR